MAERELTSGKGNAMSRNVDFSRIPTRHDAINLRLEAWARWVRVTPQRWGTQPMFRWARSNARQWETDPKVHETLNTLEAHETERAVSILPEPNRAAIRLVYVHSGLHFAAILRKLRVQPEALVQLVNDGRDMLKNRLQLKMKDE